MDDPVCVRHPHPGTCRMAVRSDCGRDLDGLAKGRLQSRRFPPWPSGCVWSAACTPGTRVAVSYQSRCRGGGIPTPAEAGAAADKVTHVSQGTMEEIWQNRQQ